MLFEKDTISNYCEMKINFRFSVAKCKSKACRFPIGHAEFDQLIERALVTIHEAGSKEIHRDNELGA